MGVSWKALGESLDGLGEVLGDFGGSWGGLGRSWEALGGVFVGRSWGDRPLLAGLWAGLGTILAGLWAVFAVLGVISGALGSGLGRS